MNKLYKKKSAFDLKMIGMGYGTYQREYRRKSVKGKILRTKALLQNRLFVIIKGINFFRIKENKTKCTFRYT